MGLGSARGRGSTALWGLGGQGRQGCSVGVGPSGRRVGRHRAPLPVPAQPPHGCCWPHCPPEPAGCPPCLFGDWAQRRCSDRVLGARPVLTAGAAGCGCLLVPMRQRCIFALSGHCGWPPVWTSDAPTLGLLALAVAFGGGGVCLVLLPGGFPERLCQLTPTGVPAALHSCQHCLTFNHCQSGGCEMVLWF